MSNPASVLCWWIGVLLRTMSVWCGISRYNQEILSSPVITHFKLFKTHCLCLYLLLSQSLHIVLFGTIVTGSANGRWLTIKWDKMKMKYMWPILGKHLDIHLEECRKVLKILIKSVLASNQVIKSNPTPQCYVKHLQLAAIYTTQANLYLRTFKKWTICI